MKNEIFLRSMTQGSVFTGVSVKRYLSRPVFGLVITARCDIANQKFPVLNFIPCISLRDWLDVDGCRTLRKATLAQKSSIFAQRLVASGISPSILNTISPTTACRELLPDRAKKRQETVSLAEEIEMLGGLDLEEKNDRDKLYSVGSAQAQAAITDIIRYRNQNYYFLPSLGSGFDDGYVASLREISFLSEDIAYEIARSIRHDELKEVYPDDSFGLIGDFFDSHELIGCIPSPQIEHLLQSLSHLFGRIGLDGMNEDDLNGYVRKVVSDKIEVKV